jgi:hypothetical protein
MKINRYISVFDGATEELRSTVPLSETEFRLIRRHLGVSEPDPMYDSYPIDRNVLTKVLPVLGNRLPIGPFTYYLEAEAEA